MGGSSGHVGPLWANEPWSVEKYIWWVAESHLVISGKDLGHCMKKLMGKHTAEAFQPLCRDITFTFQQLCRDITFTFKQLCRDNTLLFNHYAFSYFIPFFVSRKCSQTIEWSRVPLKLNWKPNREQITLIMFSGAFCARFFSQPSQISSCGVSGMHQIGYWSKWKSHNRHFLISHLSLLRYIYIQFSFWTSHLRFMPKSCLRRPRGSEPTTRNFRGSLCWELRWIENLFVFVFKEDKPISPPVTRWTWGASTMCTRTSLGSTLTSWWGGRVSVVVWFYCYCQGLIVIVIVIVQVREETGGHYRNTLLGLLPHGRTRWKNFDLVKKKLCKNLTTRHTARLETRTWMSATPLFLHFVFWP